MTYTQAQVRRAVKAAKMEQLNLLAGILFMLVFFTGLGFLVAGYHPTWLIVNVSIMFGWIVRALTFAAVNG